jgi:uncharacterized Zn-binding protein involved in type VI secretion
MAEKHIGIRESQYVVLSTAPDVCMVGIVPVPFDSFQDLSYEKSYISNVRARGKSILTVGSVIAGTQSNAGMGIISGTSLDKGDCEILTGVAHIKCKGKAIARYGSLVMMNNGNTIGTLYTQVNPPNGPVPVAKNVSFLEKLTEQEVERQWLQMEAMQQMPDSYEGMGKNFINNQYEFGRQLGEGGMQNGSMEFEEQIAILKLMGADTSLMEKANELNQTTIEEIDVSPPLLEMENETQERGAKLENALEWVLIIKGLTKGALSALKWLRGGTGVGGVKVVAGVRAILQPSGVIRKFDGSILVKIPQSAKVRKLTPPDGHLGAYGYEYKWASPVGRTITVRIHGIDPSAPAGSNASRGWVVRIFDGKKSMDSNGVYHPPGIFNESSPHYDPSVINDVHIPILEPINFPGAK